MNGNCSQNAILFICLRDKWISPGYFYFLFHIKAESAECHSQFIPTVLLACKNTNLVTITARIASENNDSGFANVYIWFYYCKNICVLSFSCKQTKVIGCNCQEDEIF